MRALALLCALFLSSDAYALRCGHQLVQVGDYKAEVLDRCGEPDSIDRRMALKGQRLRHPFGTLEIDRFEEVEIEEWIYNFGRRKFKQLLQFENGILIEIRELGYGY